MLALESESFRLNRRLDNSKKTRAATIGRTTSARRGNGHTLDGIARSKANACVACWLFGAS